MSLQAYADDDLMCARVPPVVNHVECHPSWKQTKLRDFCKSKGVHLFVRKSDKDHKGTSFETVNSHNHIA
ncbi:hypothetical protein L2E82_39691 [Cichorium intybus]|uniref:Uncharacterized protein n=1 Tax=Cichorium intybus TaxID=13427 RepID=A0ACB9AIE0_CICIN|nr:hypothetical protein L2E82_39691 [Cichorium intybus]